MQRNERGHFVNGNQIAAIDWCAEMTETLLQLRREGVSFTAAAERIGVSTDAAIRKAKKLGIWQGRPGHE